jgi:hypothetical protein
VLPTCSRHSQHSSRLVGEEDDNMRTLLKLAREGFVTDPSCEAKKAKNHLELAKGRAKHVMERADLAMGMARTIVDGKEAWTHTQL